jgi:hypothetical protein
MTSIFALDGLRGDNDLEASQLVPIRSSACVANGSVFIGNVATYTALIFVTAHYAGSRDQQPVVSRRLRRRADLCRLDG